MTHKELDRMICAVQSALDKEADFPCTRKKPDPRNENKPTACIGFDYGIDEEGRPRFWYGFDCANFVRKNFCPTCSATWLVAVARNIMLDDGRVHKNADDKAASP